MDSLHDSRLLNKGRDASFSKTGSSRGRITHFLSQTYNMVEAS